MDDGSDERDPDPERGPGRPAAEWARWRAEVDLDEYDTRWERLAASGVDPHGEVDLVVRYRPRRVLDAGCGTGRVAIELDRRGIEVTGVDLDPDLLARARARAPSLRWMEADLAALDDVELGGAFDVVVAAGNVIGFVDADRRTAVVHACARRLAPGGRLVAGFQLRPDWPTLQAYDAWCTEGGLVLEDRWSTWDRRPIGPDPDYAVSVHRRDG
ncbi:MAG: class I SAM-dependent methyltransferase [Acidimicrobiales bacterium]|jgi:SAM-dependent methyltransferase|nr:class I SAM-dependent methyltransferase [Acidimicrobiales bacterium]